ncbi:unnamed protein product [Pseudo-nitzschia multistriata]|uniref:Uncharacterized protein n=1 Tax=Pseudo-nitzschia multistriata TaxID=183589 RepID=A0A448ZDR7_9STRA|nr:unnamed protein product [Pseudo-nitzschia multistriata]
MSIDLQWVRNDPDRVREFQALRRRAGARKNHGSGDGNSNSNSHCESNDGGGGETEDPVGRVLRLDGATRALLRALQGRKRRLGELGRALRPGPDPLPFADREALLREKKALQASIVEEEAAWRASEQDTLACLCELAGPVEGPPLGGWGYGDGDGENDSDSGGRDARRELPPVLGGEAHRSVLAMDLAQAWRAYTLRCFGNYPSVELPQPCTTPRAENDPWLRLLEECLPRGRSIWGEKELPRFAAAWSGDSRLDLLALCPPGGSDAREIQADLFGELVRYFGPLVGGCETESGSRRVLKRYAAPPPDLDLHEWSRHELHLVPEDPGAGLPSVLLGAVSHRGDARTRAKGMAFAGGGLLRAGGKHPRPAASRAVAREFVHLVQASVAGPWTWNAVLSCRRVGGTHLEVPACLVPHLARPVPASGAGPERTVPLEDLVVPRRGGGSRLFGERKPAAAEGLAAQTQAFPRFPPLGPPGPGEREQRARWDRLSCPFGVVVSGPPARP